MAQYQNTKFTDFLVKHGMKEIVDEWNHIQKEDEQLIFIKEGIEFFKKFNNTPPVDIHLLPVKDSLSAFAIEHRVCPESGVTVNCYRLKCGCLLGIEATHRKILEISGLKGINLVTLQCSQCFISTTIQCTCVCCEKFRPFTWSCNVCDAPLCADCIRLYCMDCGKKLKSTF